MIDFKWLVNIKKYCIYIYFILNMKICVVILFYTMDWSVVMKQLPTCDS